MFFTTSVGRKDMKKLISLSEPLGQKDNFLSSIATVVSRVISMSSVF